MDPPLPVPTVSILVEIPPRDLDHPSATVGSFGFSWRHHVLDVAAFRICTDTIDDQVVLSEVENLAPEVASAGYDMHVDRQSHVFALLPREYVERIDVCWRDGFAIKGLRFHTNQRVSQWFGAHHEDERSSLEAPEGHYLKAMYGVIVDAIDGGRGGFMGAVVARLPVSNAPKKLVDDEALYARSGVVHGSDEPQRTFRFDTLCATPRAVVINLDDDYVVSLTVVSSDQYELVNALEDIRIVASEHWFVLVDDERLEAVGLVFESGRVATTRLRTNLRTSVWFGKDVVGAEATWLDCTDQPAGAFICGLQVEAGVETERLGIMGLGAIYNAGNDATYAVIEAPAVSNEASQAAQY